MNNVEITSASNPYGFTDSDDDIAVVNGSSDDTSELDTDDDHDDEYGTTPGTADNLDDEDSYDPAMLDVVQIYDLALVKVLDSETTPEPYIPGADVAFIITVTNQGTLDAADIEITDYLPAGLTLTDSNWTDNGNGTATYTHSPVLQPGESVDISINFTVAGTVFTTITNRAEISDDDAQETYGMDDIDSTPDADTTNDNQPTTPYNDPSDDETREDGKNGGDEDDHDLASLEPSAFDLALTKVLKDPSIVYMQGDDVTFTITVDNQGYLDGENIEITDYIPADLTLNDTDWTDNGDGTASTTIATVPLQSSVDVDITFTIDPLFQ